MAPDWVAGYLCVDKRCGRTVELDESTWECFPLTLVGSSPKLGGDSRRDNARQIEPVGWEESRSRAFSRSSLLT